MNAIYSASGAWSVDSNGKLMVQELEVRGSGITVYDRATGQPKCVFVEQDIVRSEAGPCNNQESNTQNTETTTSSPETATSTPIIIEPDATAATSTTDTATTTNP